MSAASATPQWEQFKENAAPLSRGRNVQTLSHALSTPQCISSSHRKEEDKNIRNFEHLVRPTEKFASLYSECDPRGDVERIEELLRQCGLDHKCDPMVQWARYIKYHEEMYPSDTHAQFLLMERCTQALFHYPKYKNDVRFIRVCALYADKTSDPQEQFKIFHKHKIGSEVALFWLSWAWVAETRKDFTFAEKIFKKAMQKKAKPEKTVKTRYNQFQRRMSRHWLNAASDAREVESVYDGEEINERRGALSGLTREGTRQNHRGRGANAMASLSDRNRNRVAPSLTSNGRPPTRSHNGRPPQSGGFVIFSDENDYDEGGYDLNQSTVYGDENLPLPRMVKEKDKKKENTLAPEAWNERGGLRRPGHGYGGQIDQNNNDPTSSVLQRWAGNDDDGTNALGVESQPAFQVFVDEECTDGGGSDPARRGRPGKSSDRVLRQRLEDGIKGREPLEPTRGILKQTTVKFHNEKRSGRGVPPKRSSKEATAEVSKSKREKSGYGYDEKLVAKDRNGSEGCFEAYRAKKRLFKIAPGSTDFNLMHRVQPAPSANDSCMDIDDGSTVEDVEMDDMSYSMGSITEKDVENEMVLDVDDAGADSDAGAAGCPGRLDNLRQHGNQSYPTNTLGNRSLNTSRGHNTSTASSTVDERDAVGVVGDREETLNTKFAARELSMMFSSPAGAVGANNKSKLLFSIHQDAEESREEESIDAGNQMSILMPPQRCAKQQAAAFTIFCDDEADHKEQGGVSAGLTIYDENEEYSADSSKSNQPAAAAGGFGIYEDSDDSSNDGSLDRSEDRNGDTASLADLMEIMKDTSPIKGKKKAASLRLQQRSDVKSGELAIFCDDDENGTILTEDTAAFGDISLIPHGESDTCNLQDKMKGLSVSSSGGRGGGRRFK